MVRKEPDIWVLMQMCTASPSFAYAEDEVNLVTALVPSETACLASSPGSMRRTEVWISRDERVAFLE